MKFQDAHAKLKAIAEGRYCSTVYDLTTYANGDMVVSCGLYIDGAGWFKDKTWGAAFHALNVAMHPEQFIEEMPEVEG